MTIHLQESVENEFLLKLFKFVKTPVFASLSVAGSEKPLEGDELKRVVLENRRRVKKGLPPLPTARKELKCGMSDVELCMAWLVQEVEVHGPGTNPIVRLRIWNPEGGCYDFRGRLNYVSNILISHEEPPKREEGSIYDVKRKFR